MAYKKRFYENLPIYARLADEESGLLALLCDRLIQPHLDDIQRLLRQQEHFYDPDHPLASTHLDWLGQFVALGSIQGHFLGIGINPNWSVEQKRRIIWRAWKYWQVKGSEKGVREAIALWLQWEPAHDEERLLINHPFGDRPIATPPQWWGWASEFNVSGGIENRYDAHLLQKYPERQHLGSGDYPGTFHQPFYHTLQQPSWAWDYGRCWSDRELDYVAPPIYEDKWSRLGPRNIWLHAYLKEYDWNRIFPDIFELLDEALPVTAIPTVFGWIESLRAVRPVSLIESEQSVETRSIAEFIIDGAQYGDLVPHTSTTTTGDSSEFLAGGTLWYYPPKSAYTTITQIEETTLFGFWAPESWYGMWWGTTIERSTIETPVIEVDVLQTPEQLPLLEVDLDGVKELGLDIAPWWYAAWGEYPTIRDLELYHPGSDCIPGIEIAIPDMDRDIPALDFGLTVEEVTNQFLVDAPISSDLTDWIESSVEDLEVRAPEPLETVEPEWETGELELETKLEEDWDAGSVGVEINPGETDWNPAEVSITKKWLMAEIILDPNELEENWKTAELFTDENLLVLQEPVEIATHYTIQEEYPWIFNSGLESSLLAEPLTVPSLDSIPQIEIGYQDREVGQLCNVFASWSKGGISQYRERKEPILPNAERGLFDIYPSLAIASDAKNWGLFVETDEELYVLKPITIFWENSRTKERSVEFSFDEGFTDLYLEFIFQPKEDTHIRSATLWLGEQRIHHQTFYYPLNAPQEAQIGFDFNTPFRLPSGWDSPEDELAVEELLPLLRQQLARLEERIVPTIEPVETIPLVPVEALPNTPTAQSLRDVLTNISDRLTRLERVGGDLHLQHRIATPTTQVRIRHNFGRFGKQPSITINVEGMDVEATPVREDENTVTIYFSEAVTGWVYFN